MSADENFKDFLSALPERVPDLKQHPLDYTLNNIQRFDLPKGAVLEFGVFSGNTITKIANCSTFKNQTVYGFDSFQGLPEAWERNDMHFPKGAFDMNGKLPPVPQNVELIAGWFDQTVPRFAEYLTEPIVFLHVDCDLYSSTKCIFDHLQSRFADGILIIFDELFNYDNYQNHEILALYELCRDHNWTIEWIGKNGPVVIDCKRDNGYWDQPAAVRLWKKKLPTN